MLYTFILSISIPNCKSIAHFLGPKWGVFYIQKHANYDVRFQSRFLLFLGVVRKNKWHHWIPEEKLVQMPALPPVRIRRYRLHASIHGRHPLSPEAKLVMHCGSCCDALWVTADAAAGAWPGAATTNTDLKPSVSDLFGYYSLPGPRNYSNQTWANYYGFQTVCKCPFWALLVTLVTDSNQAWAN